jgi:hypothetical protein
MKKLLEFSGENPAKKTTQKGRKKTERKENPENPRRDQNCHGYLQLQCLSMLTFWKRRTRNHQ